ncbi:hypothetical protein [Polymorphospora sp. NPDC050346]|uniref:hypothetical protein n=1 Tax=Polymorphospora sp. NPDC050346 TaxID=3155780 RepID=UPI0033E564C7
MQAVWQGSQASRPSLAQSRRDAQTGAGHGRSVPGSDALGRADIRSRINAIETVGSRCYTPRMRPTPLSRWLTRVALIMATCVAASTVAAPPATAQPSGLTLKSLSFASKRVDVREQSVAVTLTWTVRNTNPEAEYLSGSVRLRMAGSTPGTYVGTTRDINFWLYSSWEGVRHVSGDAQESTYEYDFVVPRYGKTTSALWVVAGFNASDDKGATLTLEGAQLAGHRPWLKARTLVDSTPPTIASIESQSKLSYVYVGSPPAGLGYDARLQDSQAGFWKGTLRVVGPDGQILTGDFEAKSSSWEQDCRPPSFGGDITDCPILVDVPAGTVSGVWQIADLTLFDNVGNETTIVPPGTAPVTLTSNEVVSVSDFSATPNPVDNWSQDATTRIRLDVEGAQNGISTVRVDFEMPWCQLDGSGPTIDPDGAVSVGVIVRRHAQECIVNGVLVVGGAGNAAVYGYQWGTDPLLIINRLPNTTPPTASAVVLTPTTVSRSQAAHTTPTLTMQVTAPVAPLTGYDLNFYDSAGSLVANYGGGAGTAPDGTLRLYAHLPYGIAAGTYSYGFTLHDASGLRSSYGVNGQPLPGGPLEITVTDD